MSKYSRVPNSEDDVQVVELQVPPSTVEASTSRSPSPIPSTNNNVDSDEIIETESTPMVTETTLPVVTDGVFSNLSAKPDTEADKEDENPPPYETAAADAAPPYWETTIIAPGLSGDEILVEGLPVGNFFSFVWNMLVSMSFQFVGFLLTYLLHTNHAAKNGSRAGLGITLVQYGFYLRGRALQDDDYYYDENINDKEVMARSAWLSYILMFLGWFIVIRSVSDFIRVKRMETVMRTTPEENV
ncbi:3490_t:CDS:2 [Rhizophagus irregularis]|nr:3490_t:CDS:2 [Rhizophagus irregularis]